MADQRGRGRPGRPSGPSRAGGRGGKRADGSTGKSAGRSGGRGRSSDKPRREGARRPQAVGRSPRQDRTDEQRRYDGPPLDEEITGAELDRSVRQQLRGLPEKLATRVARHLVAAGLALEEDPQTAYEHALAARTRAPRVAIVREAAGEAAYAAGKYAEALAELRAARRINGAIDYLPVMADCERALGRPEKALALAHNPAVDELPTALRAEMVIVEAGARRDQGQVDAALRTLESAPLRSRSRESWVARLRYAYADTLLAAGRRDEAVEWFHRTVGVDSDEVTDAAERIAELGDGAMVEDIEGPERQ